MCPLEMLMPDWIIEAMQNSKEIPMGVCIHQGSEVLHKHYQSSEGFSWVRPNACCDCACVRETVVA